MFIRPVICKKALVIASLMAVLWTAGCSTYRLMPSHGGGKRFDEEQRAVASCIRNTIAQMDLKSLSGHKVNLTIVSLSQNGGASLTMPGLSNISASYNDSSSDYEAPYMVDSQKGFYASANFNPNMNAWPTVFPTDQDQTYMESSLQMKLRLQQSMVAVPDPEFMLYVLVDVLGTNRSKIDSIIYSKDVLLATCEVTYYIVDLKTGKVAGKAKQVSSQSGYLESGWFGFSGSHVERSTSDMEPTAMPTDANDLPTVTMNPITAVGLKPKSAPTGNHTAVIGHAEAPIPAAAEPNVPLTAVPTPAAAAPAAPVGIVPIPAAAPVATPTPASADPNAPVSALPTPTDVAAKTASEEK